MSARACPNGRRERQYDSSQGAKTVHFEPAGATGSLNGVSNRRRPGSPTSRLVGPAVRQTHTQKELVFCGAQRCPIAVASVRRSAGLMNMTYKLVILDFDGTLADSAGWFVEALNELAPRHRFRTVGAAEIETLRGLGNREIVRRLGIARWRIPLIATELRRRAAADTAGVRLFDGARELVEALGRRTTCAVVSSNAEANVRRLLGPASDAILFDCGAGLYGKAKRFRRVMKRAGVSPTETLCVGDEQRDIEAAQAVGAASGAVLWGYAAPDLLVRSNPTMTFDHPMAVLDALGTAVRGPETRRPTVP